MPFFQCSTLIKNTFSMVFVLTGAVVAIIVAAILQLLLAFPAIFAHVRSLSHSKVVRQVMTARENKKKNGHMHCLRAFCIWISRKEQLHFGNIIYFWTDWSMFSLQLNTHTHKNAHRKSPTVFIRNIYFTANFALLKQTPLKWLDYVAIEMQELVHFLCAISFKCRVQQEKSQTRETFTFPWNNNHLCDSFTLS